MFGPPFYLYSLEKKQTQIQKHVILTTDLQQTIHGAGQDKVEKISKYYNSLFKLFFCFILP